MRDHLAIVNSILIAQEPRREEHMSISSPHTSTWAFDYRAYKIQCLEQGCQPMINFNISETVNTLNVINYSTESHKSSIWKSPLISKYITFLRKHDSEFCRHFQPLQENVDVSSLYPKHSCVFL